MLIQNLKVSGLLSFGPEGIDLPMKGLNVLIGPNGSGKSNLLSILSLLKAAPTDLSEPIREDGGIGEWLWKGGGACKEGEVEVNVAVGSKTTRHSFLLRSSGVHVELSLEVISDQSSVLSPSGDFQFDPLADNYGMGRLVATLNGRSISISELTPGQSILSQIKDPIQYPDLAFLQRHYAEMRLYRTWTFGPKSPFRSEQSAHLRHDHLDDGCQNLAVVLGAFPAAVKRRIGEELRVVYEGITGIDIATMGAGNVALFLVEEGGREIPASRMSDGTLRYLSLLAILLHPTPPALIAIEEPELGLHPDVIPKIADLLVEASQRTQLVVTTHSRMLVDALSDQPESIVVCSKEAGQTKMERLNAEDLNEWLERYTLGELWIRGEIGGNRW
jgi:predicted ATPase